ncbi:hypothetical protein BG015_011964 [Linnemannia schmuckeri]|uniref:BTB domain-containing protein n=1 Tax=Linnemannia schmuckeri TaxID=64567 RepID=A0A9P5RRT1_9FUNG|nr:hypothetical protein BG015_011964 [Linnemannia schmuckeri]
MPPKRTGFTSQGIREPLTNRISGILDEYPDGTQIARELLQNSDDARSTVQWYLLDHHDYRNNNSQRRSIAATVPFEKQSAETSNGTGSSTLRLFHDDLQEYMGPALLAGNDSVFEEKDFESLKHLAASEKRMDESKIGQMGIGFNSIYHLTDCPSFITGDQFMVIEPHERIFNGKNSEFKEGAVRGNFAEGNQGINEFPDQLRAFSVLEDIDFSKPYSGTVFRFPLRTKEQAKTSDISKYAYTPDKVREMLIKLKEEALKALLFLRHVEKIVIYERKKDQEKPTKLFQIEIVNAEEVRRERLKLLGSLKAHVNPKQSASQEDILSYSVRPIYRITQEDRSTIEETWHISTLVGNVLKSKEYMMARTDGNINNHRLIPWVGIAAPTEPEVKIDASRLFCFLPIGIQLPFPVHINGHFAVKQSRREIWTNQDNDFSSQASANIKSLWNVHLFEKQVPEVFAMFLEDVGLDHGTNYDLWPTSCGESIGLDAIWKDLLKNVLKAVISQDRKVFVCGSKIKDNSYIRQYSTLYIAGRDVDRYPLLKESLHAMVNLAEGIPNVILREIAALIPTLGIDQVILTPAHVREILFDNRERWSATADSATRIEMVRYCLLDNDIAGLEGLPLLPFDGDIWDDFAQGKAQERFYVPRLVFETLSQANAGLVDLNVEGYPFDQINALSKNITFWIPMPPSSIAMRVRWAFQQACYRNSSSPAGCISQSPERFPTDEWIMDFWDMAHELEDCKELLSGLAGVHLLPVGRGQLAPLSTKQRAIHLNRVSLGNVGVMQKACSILEQHLGCNVLRSWFRPPASLQRFIVEISDAPGILGLLHGTKADMLVGVSQKDRAQLASYLAAVLQMTAKLTDDQKRALRRLPVYRMYSSGNFEPLDALSASSSPSSTMTARQWRLAQGYLNLEHPWLPPSIDLLADDQPLREHLDIMLEVPVLSESEYWYLLVSNMTKQDESEWDAIMTKLAPAYHVHSKAYDLASALRSIPFVSATSAPKSTDDKGTGLRSLIRNLPFVSTKLASAPQQENAKPMPTRSLSPESVVHPSLAVFFQDTEAVFPAGVYGEAPLFGILSELGMYSTFDAAFVQERIKTLFGSGDLRMEEHRKIVEALYGRLNSDCSEAFLSPDLRKVLKTVPWVYTGPDDGWQTPADCRPQRDRALVGNRMPLAEFTFTNEALLDCVGWKLPPPLETVLQNLCSIARKYKPQVTDESTAATSDVADTRRQKALNNLDIMPIYEYLAEKVKEPESLKFIRSTLRNQAWVLVSGTFYTVDRVALKMHCDLQPHFVQVPAADLDDFYLTLGVREHIQQVDMEDILASVGSRYAADESISATDADLVYRLLTGIADGPNPTWSADLLMLTEDGTLKRAADVVYDDVNVRKGDLGARDLPYTFVHRRISHEMAERLKLTMFSVRCWEDAKDNSFDPFFQQENIVDRIKGILNDYDPSSIFNEFLQNASDAGATEYRFWLDSRSFGTDKVLSKQMAAWQGPALMIYNDAEFSDKDFDALCRLGVGNKKEDTLKIGRHGLGFNSVYHFTDVPSIVSGPYIGFFDPHMTNLPMSRDRNGSPIVKGGLRCDFRKLSMETLADQLEPYKGILGCDMRSHFKGTLFRIPLRIVPAEVPTPAPAPGVTVESTAATGSGFGSVGWTVPQIRRMMDEWVEDAKVGLLFLKNVKTIQISDGFKPQVTVSKSTSVKSDLLKPSSGAPGLSDSIVMIEATPAASASESSASSLWLVCCDDAFPSNTVLSVRQLAAMRYWSPQRGVAIQIQGTVRSEFQSKLFVHLPTPILTKLPFHIHGDFALTSNRKNLAGGSEEENEKHIWNSFLIETCLPGTAIRAMEQLFAMNFAHPTSLGRSRQGFNSANKAYFDQWPLRSSKQFQPFLKAFLRHAHSSPVFPCPGPLMEFPMQLKAGRDVILPGPVTIPPELELKILPWLRQGAQAISIVPDPVMSVIKAEWSKEPKLSYAQVDGDFVRSRLLHTPEFLKNDMKTSKERDWILGWAFQPVLNSKVQVSVPSCGLQVIPLLNGEWKRLGEFESMYYVATEHELGLLSAKDILVDEEVFSTKELGIVLDNLIEDDKYNVRMLPEQVFASTFLKENPGGVTDKQLKQLWDYIEEEYEGLDTFFDFPILKTSYGTMTTLGKAKTGFQISGLPYETGQKFIVFMDLLRDLNVVVYESAAHRDHRFFEDKCPEYTDLRLLEAIVTHWEALPTHRAFSRMEAKGMRELILACRGMIKRNLIPTIGNLPIWTTQGATDASTLIAARGAYYLEGHFGLQRFGAFPNVLWLDDVRIFKLIGATPLRIAVAMTDFVLPKFHSGELKCEGDNRTAYLGLLLNLFYVSTLRGHVAVAPQEVLRTARCFIARDGSFHAQGELALPGEALTESIFADRSGFFAEQEMTDIMLRYSMKSSLRTLSSHPALIVECAEKVLAETVDATADPATTRARATQLVKYIYESPEAGGVDWMDAKWKFVPRETNLEAPYDMLAPNLPVYMAFSQLAHPQFRDLLWTRRGFFPADLVPSPAFKTKFPDVHRYFLGEMYQHLNTLVKCIAPKWKTTEQQHLLKLHLFRIYQKCESYASKDDEWRELTTQMSKYMKVPYILNGNNKDPSKANSWVWPAWLMFDIDHNISSHDVVDPILYQYRNFLVAMGAEQMQHVEGFIDVADGRKLGDMETQIMNCFETQDQDTGFMDVRFKFQEGSDILAHKVVLARASEYFFRRFTGVWASNSTRDPHEPGVQVVDLSSYGDIKTAFWGLLYYFYSDKLIPSNGPPLFDGEIDKKSASEGEGGEGTSNQGEDDSSGEYDDDAEVQTPEDKLAERVQYLMELQEVANRFEAIRLKDLIAQELVMGQKIIHSNVFNIRSHAERNQAENVREYCDKFIVKNKSSVVKYVEGEILAVREALREMGRMEAQEDDEDDENDAPSESDGENEQDEVVEEKEGKDVGSAGSKEEEAALGHGSELDAKDDEGSQVHNTDGEEEWKEVEGDWEEASIESTSEDDYSGSNDGEDNGDKEVDAIVYANAFSPARALMEEELRVLEENLAELLALS